MDHVGLVVEDLDAAIAFFTELGLQTQGTASLDGPTVDRLVALEGVRTDIAMMQAPDGTRVLELVRYRAPQSADRSQPAPVNVPGACHVTFAVDDIRTTLAGLRNHGAELVGELVNYEDIYLLCYVRGPAGVVVELTQRIG